MRGLSAALLLFVATPAAAQKVDTTTTTETDGSRTLVHEITIPAPMADVWQAIATIEGWRTWAVPLARQVIGSPDRFETGYDPDATLGAPTTIEQQWVRREAPRRVVFRTTRTPAGFPHSEAYRRVTSSFYLTLVGPALTRVRLTGTGYPSGPSGDTLIAFFRNGNRTSLEQLHMRFVSGPIDWPARLAKPKEQ